VGGALSSSLAGDYPKQMELPQLDIGHHTNKTRVKGMSPPEDSATGVDGQVEDEFPGSAPRVTILYRAMREDPFGGPVIGPSARTLGVRPHVDIVVVAGQVWPNMGGMSVAPDRPENLHPLRRPPKYGGSGKDPIWCIEATLLGNDLQFRRDSPTHGLIEPARAMLLDEYQQALQATTALWKKMP